jgi:hypothetical protein
MLFMALLNCHSQNDSITVVSDLIKKHFQDKDYKKVKENYLVLKSKYSAEIEYPETLLWLAKNFYLQSDYQNAKYYFFEMYNNDFSVVKKKSRGIEHQYAYGFISISALYLTKICYLEKSFDSCLNLIINRKVKTLENVLRNDTEQEFMHYAILASKCYFAKSQNSEAIECIKKYIFCDFIYKGYDELFTHKDLIDLFIDILKAKYSIKEIKNELFVAIGKIEYNSKYLNFFNYSIPIYRKYGGYYNGFEYEFINGNSEAIRNYILKSRFYNEISNQP